MMKQQVIKRLFFLTLCCCLSKVAVAKDELMIAVGLAKPPYVIQDNDTGFELDLIRTIIKKMGKSTTFVYTQFGHSSKMLDVADIDAVMTTNQRVFSDKSKLSDIYITYQNVAISLTERNLVISSIDDLANYSIASFQKADKVLGQAFANVIEKSPLYMKIADQSQQPPLLIKQRVDVLIMDKNIFNYFARQQGVTNGNELFTYHPIFPETHYRIAFKNKEYIPVFNKIYAEFRFSPEYQQLKQHYGLQ